MDNALIASWPKSLAKLSGRLAGRDISVALSCGETGPVFILRPEPAGLEFFDNRVSESAFEEGQTNFILEADGEEWRISAWGRAAETLLAPPDGLNAEDIPAELKPALLALALEPHLDRASRALGHSFRLGWPPRAEARPKDAAPENSDRGHFMLPFILADSSGNPAGAGRARIPVSAAALSVLADLVKAFPRRPAPDCSSLPLSLSLCAGRESFPVNILRAAEPGDVLRFSCPAKPALTLEAAGLALWTASLADGKITIEGILNKNPEEAAMSARPENVGTSAAGSKAPGLSPEAIDALEIILTLELDERRITIGELAALGPGQILDTAASLDAPVTIKAGGKAVGKGRLVEVGDSLGVLISSLDLGARDGGGNAACSRA
ncbi:MAG: type III secretion system cytoplasmic ring protein SctQ [Deltaproteobacteria bacterium]|jgi:type III secretion system YscQ/HrcQ family protein|nr:type III secretion system cytoplasmic ring protein SctQ [Deltaproteobacteria bacterium]